ncbi:CobW C-terminal domain-containing protein [Pseudomonas marincola]|uniref:CobW C-terminal domain-containing protein n=1 Tax=Pseudomonas marincola TaxID=437900 RepID=A0A653E3Z5_9PSED|nr:CobW family GTP-binding protein [Pseudomonas marincola]CAE6881863.1 CobW C-terminal domain-containing protein [Pseudomonas marincola]
MQTPEPVPFTVITGFLGAGKTTYLNNLIREGLPRDSLIVVNDFGSINIDAELIEYRDERILQLGNGCICCTLGGTLAEQLAQAVRFQPRPAAIYVEASGVAEPARIADIARVSCHLRLASVVCLVDASQVTRHASNRYTADVWQAQVVGADQLLVNRMPPAQSAEYEQVFSVLKRLNPHATFNGTESHINDREIPSAPARPLFSVANTQQTAGLWDSVSLSYSNAIDGDRLEQLLSEYADVVMRAKGILKRTDRPVLQVFQLSGGVACWLPARRAPAANQLVCIGIKGTRFEALASALAQLDGVLISGEQQSHLASSQQGGARPAARLQNTV